MPSGAPTIDPTTYAALNLAEAVAWICLGLYLVRSDSQVQSVLVRWGLPGLLALFAGTDLAEVLIRGPLPTWLWWSKLIVGSSLFALANLRDHLVFGPLTAAKCILRTVAFGLLLGFYFRVTR